MAFGAFHGDMPTDGTEGRLVVNGQLRASAPVNVDVAARCRAVARLLGAIGEQLQNGDRLLTGSVVQVALRPGDDVVADFGRWGQAAATIERE